MVLPALAFLGSNPLSLCFVFVRGRAQAQNGPVNGVNLNWRREWDLNPRWASPRRFSRPVHSAALSSLRGQHYRAATSFYEGDDARRRRVRPCAVAPTAV